MKAPSDKKFPLKVHVLVLNESTMMSVAAVIDTMRAVNLISEKLLIDWRLVSADGRPVTLTNGLQMASHGAMGAFGASDYLIVIAGVNPLRNASARLISALARRRGEYNWLAGIEEGSWILAKAGFLNGRRATTHWTDLKEFAEEFPEVEVSNDRFVIDGEFITASGPVPALDMMLHIIRFHFGPSLAINTAGLFIYDEVRSPGGAQPLGDTGKVSIKEPRVAQAVRIMERTLDKPIATAAIAKRSGISIRQLELLFQRNLRVSPSAFYSGLRLNEARRLVLDTNLPMGEIATRTGYASLSAFSRAMKQWFGMAGQEMRNNARN